MRAALALFPLALALSACRTEDSKIDTGTPQTCTWYADDDDDGFGDPQSTAEGACGDPAAGFVANADDCDDGNPAINPDATEVCDGVDQDCDGQADEDAPDAPAWYADADADGFGDPESAVLACEAPTGRVLDGTDCDDENAETHPDAAERCNEVDDDCDGAVDEDMVGLWFADADGDGWGNAEASLESCDPGAGWVAVDGDCDDSDPAVFPDAEEVCDGVDQDCDGAVDDGLESTWYADADGDGFGDAAVTVAACDPGPGWVAVGSDCDDANSAIFPGAVETCDGLDDDCDGLLDDADPDVSSQSTWYADADGDGYGDGGLATAACEAPSGTVALGGDCDDTDPAYNPGAVETDCTDPHDYNCDGSTGYADADGDGWAACAECDDGDAAVNPDAAEVCDGVDDDCDGLVDEPDALDAATWYADRDGDGYGDAGTFATACNAPGGYVADATDCDDAAAGTHPGAAERCDGVDQDCDGFVDEGVTSTFYADTDGDGYGDPAVTTAACAAPGGYVADATDCDDGAPGTHPGAAEHCDGVDEDCDGATDEVGAVDAPTWYRDLDADGYGDAAASTVSCAAPSGYVAAGTDCDDHDDDVYPGASEHCDGVDEDCDGIADDNPVDARTWYADADGDGYGDPVAATVACTAPAGTVTTATDCDDADASVHPRATEHCDGVDEDCDGTVDDGAVDTLPWYADADGDGYGDAGAVTRACSAPTGTVASATDCDDGDAGVHLGATEVCNGVDDDCDGLTDDADPGVVGTSTWYADADGDGYGSASYSRRACVAPSGYVAGATDCNDSAASVHPGAPEACNGLDDDCDGGVDEGVTTTWYLDYDGDGYGVAATAVTACTAPSSYYVATSGDCDDLEAAAHPGAIPGCDGDDWDCDGLVDNDADADGYADAACGGDDCDDSDALVLPEVGGGCALGTTCLDVLDGGYSVGDGYYTIDPDGWGTGLDPFEVYCDMTTDGGGWTAIDYDADLAYAQHFTAGDQWYWLGTDFTFELDDEEIQAIQDLSTEGWQTYVGLCQHVVHYYYTAGSTYSYAFGFQLWDGSITPRGMASYLPYSVTVDQDGCRQNGGEGGSLALATIFTVESVLVPIVNVSCRDCGDTWGEYFGSPLSENPAWLR